MRAVQEHRLGRHSFSEIEHFGTRCERFRQLQQQEKAGQVRYDLGGDAGVDAFGVGVEYGGYASDNDHWPGNPFVRYAEEIPFADGAEAAKRIEE